MLPTSLCAERHVWIDKGIAIGAYSGLNIDLSPSCRDWLNQIVRPHRWWWDYFIEEREVAMYFVDPKDAMLFKLTWL